MAELGIVDAGARSARALAAQSQAALDRPLRGAAELWVAVATDRAPLLGAFGRTAVPGAALRRGSGGPEVRVTPGAVHVLVSLREPGALVPCDEKRVVNRLVRPLLRALTRVGHHAHYFGRDWVSVAGRPVAWVGFGHDAASRRTVFEALVATAAPFAPPGRASFLGKEPGALEGADPSRIARAVLDAYAREGERVDLPPPELGDAPFATADPPWSATREEAIGTLGAGPDAAGVFRLGGDLLASRDALARLEAAAPGCADVADLARLVDDALATPGVALDGVRSLTSVRDVLADALGL